MVHFESQTNSTLFTDCCNTAICDDEKECPGCGKRIELSPRQRWDKAMIDSYGLEKVREMRAKVNEKIKRESKENV